jgi:hypothetical protein
MACNVAPVEFECWTMRLYGLEDEQSGPRAGQGALNQGSSYSVSRSRSRRVTADSESLKS